MTTLEIIFDMQGSEERFNKSLYAEFLLNYPQDLNCFSNKINKFVDADGSVAVTFTKTCGVP